MKNLALALLAVSSLAFVGCQTAGKGADCKAVKAGTVASVNSMCVIENKDPVDPSVATVDYNGKKVGFCCNGCTRKWAKMNDEQKSAALATAMSMPH